MAIGLSVAGANRHDIKMAEKTLESMPIDRPEPTKRHPQNMCLDKGYDFPSIDELVGEWGYTGHIARRGRRPVEEEANPRISREKMGRREDPLVDEPVQAAPHQVGGGEKELRRNATLGLCVDYLASNRIAQEATLFGLALSEAILHVDYYKREI